MPGWQNGNASVSKELSSLEKKRPRKSKDFLVPENQKVFATSERRNFESSENDLTDVRKDL